MPDEVLWDLRQKAWTPKHGVYHRLTVYISEPLFSSEHLCNLAPFQSGKLGYTALKTPNVLFSENSLLISEAAPGCCSGFPEPNRTSQSSWEMQVLPDSSRFTSGVWIFEVPFFETSSPYYQLETTATATWAQTLYQAEYNHCFLNPERKPRFQELTCPGHSAYAWRRWRGI